MIRAVLCTHYITLMRVTHFSITLYVLSSEGSKLLNINGQHVCSNIQSCFSSYIYAAQSELTSVLWLVLSIDSENTASFERTFHISPATHAVSLQDAFKFTEVRLIQMHPYNHSSKFSVFLVGQGVCLTHSNFSWHTLDARNGTLCEGQNALMNWANWNSSP